MAKNSLPSPLESALANAPTFGLPESFNVLVKELQRLALNVELIEAK